MQMAMVLTPQKPTQRDRDGKISKGLPGSTLERGRRGEKRQERGRPGRVRRRESRGARQTDLEPRKGKPGYGRRPEPTRPEEPSAQGSEAEQKRGEPKTRRESDQPILLRDGSAAHKGKGLTEVRSWQRKHCPARKRRIQQCQPPCWQLPTTSTENLFFGASATEASTFEEPGARKRHAGICAGAVGKLAVLPR